MSLYKDPRSPYWRFDFRLGGHRFYDSTKCTTKREAETVERAAREKAKRHVTQIRAAATSLRLDDVAGTYWLEVGQHHVGADNTWRLLGYLIDFFGKDKLITDITDGDVAKLVAWRRGHRVREDGPLISPSTVNDTIEQLRKLFTRAKMLGVRFDHQPQWSKHLLTEPQERVRELVDDEAERLAAAARDDYAPLFLFARVTGLRLKECVTLRWDEVNWGTRQIQKLGKGGKLETVPITTAVREILWPLQEHHPEVVFTYIAQHSRDSYLQGERYPVTYSGVRTEWRRLRKRSGVTNFRFHDLRHDLGTKLLRQTGNLKLVQRALNHANIQTTTKYAHVLDSEVAEALERVTKSPNESPISKARRIS